MGIVSPNRRITKWDIKVNPDVIKSHFQRQKQLMRTYYSVAAEYFADKEAKTKSILDNQGVLPSVYCMYYHFTREVGKKIYYVGLSGPTLINEVKFIMEKWQKRGLDEVVMKAILFGVYGISLTP